MTSQRGGRGGGGVGVWEERGGSEYKHNASCPDGTLTEDSFVHGAGINVHYISLNLEVVAMYQSFIVMELPYVSSIALRNHPCVVFVLKSILV